MRWSRMASERRRAVLLDVALFAVLAAPVTYARLTPPYEPYAGALLIGSLLLLGTALVTSRRYPLAAVVIVVFGSLLDGNVVFGIPVLSYLAGLRLPRARSAAITFAALAGVGSAVNLGLIGTDLATWFLAATTLLFAGVFPWLVGRYRRQQRALVLAGWEQAEAVAREQRGTAERVRLRERARIAQDMHDSLGHELSLIALRAGALELAPDLDPRYRAAATELRSSVAAATERLREVIGVLREEAESAPVRPPDETVGELVAGAREAGMAVRLRIDDELAAVPALSRRAVHRVVQEALTNAARYAPGAPVTVVLADAGGLLDVSVTNEPPPAGSLPGPPPAGTGLLALRERVRLAGGTFEAGPRDTAGTAGAGFAVRARLPLTAGARLDEPDPKPAPGSAHRLRAARRQVRRSLLVAVATPALLAAALSLVYYPLATVNTVLDGPAFDRMRPGQPRSDLVGLPRRQVAAPDSPVPAAPAQASCEYYTDGNFPFARPAFRLCFLDGRLVSKGRVDG